MECISGSAPILPGKLDEWKALDAEMNGPRREEHARSRKRMGVTREVAHPGADSAGGFRQPLPRGRGSCEGLPDARRLGGSLRCVVPRASGGRLHGLTAEMLAGPIPATLFFDYRADG